MHHSRTSDRKFGIIFVLSKKTIHADHLQMRVTKMLLTDDIANTKKKHI